MSTVLGYAHGGMQLPSARGWTTLCLLSLAIWPLAGCSTLLSSEQSASRMASRRFEFDFVVTIPENLNTELGPVRIWVPVPVSDGAQTIDILRAPVDTTWSGVDEHGNRIAYLVWQVGGPRELHWTYRVERRQSSGGIETGDRFLTAEQVALLYLDSDNLVPVRGPVVEVADEVLEEVGRDQLPRAMYDRILQDLHYGSDGYAGHGATEFGLSEGYGDSTDYTAYWISALRSQDFAARFQIGYALPFERGAGQIKQYHAWGHYYDSAQGWVPVDLLNGDLDPDSADYFFGHLGSNQIGMSCGRDLVLSPPQESSKLNYFVAAYAEQAGREISVLTQVAYRDL
jgi:transglutaminase superfamily protein